MLNMVFNRLIHREVRQWTQEKYHSYYLKVCYEYLRCKITEVRLELGPSEMKFE